MTRRSSDWPELVLAADHRRATISAAVAAGRLRRIARGLYTPSPDDDVTVVRRHWAELVARALPGAVIVDASARAMRPDDDGRLYVDHRRQRALELPGLTVVPRPGPGPMPGDIELPRGLYASSVARGLLDNLAREDGRRLSGPEVEDWISDLLARRGEDALVAIREDARRIAGPLGREHALTRLSTLVSAALASGPATEGMGPALRSAAAGVPYDRDRVARFEACATYLAGRAPGSMPDLPELATRRAHLPFFEAYFSNYIEGTEFLVEEAVRIVYEHEIPRDRPADAHDILGTFAVVADQAGMREVPSSADELMALLRARHARLMEGRPEGRPGVFKDRPNRAGRTVFVAPHLVKGTLRAGFEAGRGLDDPFARAAFIMFLVAEVHPFIDGNGRVARMMMNAELVAASQVRIIVPTVFRGEYLSALRGATHSGAFATLASVLAFAQRYTAQVDFSSIDAAVVQLERTNAFVDPTDAERDHVRLRLPAELDRTGADTSAWETDQPGRTQAR